MESEVKFMVWNEKFVTFVAISYIWCSAKNHTVITRSYEKNWPVWQYSIDPCGKNVFFLKIFLHCAMESLIIKNCCYFYLSTNWSIFVHYHKRNLCQLCTPWYLTIFFPLSSWSVFNTIFCIRVLERPFVLEHFFEC